MLDFDAFEVLTFDCYGTLIDWETGILSGLRPALAAHGIALGDAAILESYGRLEAQAEAGAYRPYKEILRSVAQNLLTEQGITPTPEEADCLVTSFGNWKPFPDTVAALRALKRRYKLTILSNVDDDLFARTAHHLEVPFDWVITAAQVGSYKPSTNNFTFALEKMGVPKERVLHVAESLYHDAVPARVLGIPMVWVNRRQGRPGATRLVSIQPEMEVPDLRTLAERMGLTPEEAGSHA